MVIRIVLDGSNSVRKGLKLIFLYKTQRAGYSENRLMAAWLQEVIPKVSTLQNEETQGTILIFLFGIEKSYVWKEFGYEFGSEYGFV